MKLLKAYSTGVDGEDFYIFNDYFIRYTTYLKVIAKYPPTRFI